MNNEILLKVDEIVEYIKSTDDYKDYLLLKDKLDNNVEIKNIIKEIKSKQKQLVNDQYNKKDCNNLISELELLENKLNDFPLYLDFINKQNDLNIIFSVLKEKIENCFDNNIE